MKLYLKHVEAKWILAAFTSIFAKIIRFHMSIFIGPRFIFSIYKLDCLGKFCAFRWKLMISWSKLMITMMCLPRRLLLERRQKSLNFVFITLQSLNTPGVISMLYDMIYDWNRCRRCRSKLINRSWKRVYSN